MGDEIQAGRNRRLGLILGVGIGVGIVAAKGAEKMLTPSLGEWGAFGVGLLVAVAVAPAAGLLVARVLGGKRQGAEPGAAPDPARKAGLGR